MQVLKNGKSVYYISLQQFSVNSEILEFRFKKIEGINAKNCVVEILYEMDKLSSQTNENITIAEDNKNLIINWKVNDTINLTSGVKEVQLVIKNDGIVYLSKVFSITVLESLEVDKKITENFVSYLEHWEKKINEVLDNLSCWELKEW